MTGTVYKLTREGFLFWLSGVVSFSFVAATADILPLFLTGDSNVFPGFSHVLGRTLAAVLGGEPSAVPTVVAVFVTGVLLLWPLLWRPLIVPTVISSALVFLLNILCLAPFAVCNNTVVFLYYWWMPALIFVVRWLVLDGVSWRQGVIIGAVPGVLMFVLAIDVFGMFELAHFMLLFISGQLFEALPFLLPHAVQGFSGW